MKHSYQRGDFNPDKFMSRTFNRRMKARDTFTNILPLYNHEPKSCNITTYTHWKHEPWKKNIEGNKWPQ